VTNSFDAHSTTRTSVAEIRAASFSQQRQGYDENEVRNFLNKLASEIESLDNDRSATLSEVSAMRDEVARLRAQSQSQTKDPDIHSEASLQAITVISLAQQVADSTVAEAEAYARDLVVTARNQYQDILQRAELAAAKTLPELPAPGPANAGTSDHTVQVPEIECVRTCAQVAQAQLRAVLDALANEVDKLGQVPQRPPRHEQQPAPQPGPGPKAQPPLEPSWAPLPASR
jgi:DivIVA domain-containing protein